MRERLDVLLVKRKLAESREKAKSYIKEGKVLVNGVCEKKAAAETEDTAIIEVKGDVIPYVSRGGLKLEKAIKECGICLDGKVCMDVGASTGGFTDCMLQNGAAKVFAVDVGTDQLAKKLREDKRVISMEKTNIRYVTQELIGQPVKFVSVDVAFISLTKVLTPVYQLMDDQSEIVCLIKPQFEAGKEKIGKKGVVKDKRVHETVIRDVVTSATALGLEILHLTYSPIKGPEGNIEYLFYAEKKVGQEAGERENALFRQLSLIPETVARAHEELDTLSIGK